MERIVRKKEDRILNSVWNELKDTEFLFFFLLGGEDESEGETNEIRNAVYDTRGRVLSFELWFFAFRF
ncbi:hypothetical protein KJ599_09400 [bacterium]|nr:hypothetical protein [bacterium]